MSGGPDTVVRVTAEDDGQRLDRWLKKNITALPYGLAQKLIRKGAIWVDGRKAKTETRLATGQEVRIPAFEVRSLAPRPVWTPNRDDEAALRAMVIFDDGDLVALNKPHGLASQGGGGVEKHLDGMLELLKDRKERRPRLIHRLDRETSGVLLCARSPEAVRRLGAAFLHRRAQKLYLAITVPTPERDEGRIDAPLAKAGGLHKDRMIIDDGEDSKLAQTDFVVLERLGKAAAFVAFMPRTGRTHQIRVHAADALHCPLLGDGKYGGAAASIGGQEVSPRLHLHARRLILPHPFNDGEMLDISAPLPPDFRATLNALGFDAAMAESRLDDILRP